MEFNYRYHSSSGVTSTAEQSALSFAPDTHRQPTYFSGELAQPLAFREAISAMHHVVVSDQRYKPKDREAYKAWLAGQEERDLELLATRDERLRQELTKIRQEIQEIDRRHQSRWREFSRAQNRYYDYLRRRDYDKWYVLDPVITVHPDELFFECFSQDESSYARMGVDYNVFKQVGDFECGTTNIDYSAALYNEFQKIRSYKSTRFEVDPSGFEVQTRSETDYSDAFKEVKIDLPESWVRGFLQVSSAMAIDAKAVVDLHPMDLHNLNFVLRRKKEKVGPRSMRYVLSPGAPVKVIFDPWGIVVDCPRSVYHGDLTQEIRVWGRRRLHVLERLIPHAQGFKVILLGTGMPSFYVADLGPISFTLGLSGWTRNDWSKGGNFDLLAPRLQVDSLTSQRVFDALGKRWFASADQLVNDTGLDRAVVLGALSSWTQAGRAIFDVNKGVYRKRELSRDPLPMSKLRFANERESRALEHVEAGRVRVFERRLDEKGCLHLSGQVRTSKRTERVSLKLDQDGRMVEADCTSNWHRHNKLFKGPSEFLLALRLAHQRSP